jgi:hypothetical protein
VQTTAKTDARQRLEPSQVELHTRRLLSGAQLAELLNVSLSWVNKAFVYGTGPQATRVGRRRLYDPHDVAKWLETKKQRNSSERM